MFAGAKLPLNIAIEYPHKLSFWKFWQLRSLYFLPASICLFPTQEIYNQQIKILKRNFLRILGTKKDRLFAQLFV